MNGLCFAKRVHVGTTLTTAGRVLQFLESVFLRAVLDVVELKSDRLIKPFVYFKVPWINFMCQTTSPSDKETERQAVERQRKKKN